MKKLLFVIPSLRDGGAERSLVNLLSELSPKQYDIDLLLFKKGGTFYNQVPEYVHILEQPPILQRLYAPVRKAGKYMPIKVLANGLSKIVKKGMGEQKAFVWEYFYKYCIDGLDKEYDVAIGYLGGESTYYIVDKVKAKKRVHWVHNDYRTSGMPKKYDMKLFSKVDNIVTISDECLSILQEEFPVYTTKCSCIANITSSVVILNRANEFFPQEYDKCDNVILSIGRLSEQKGFDMAIDAAMELKNKGIKFKWFIVGSGPLEEKLQERIEKNKVGDYVFLLGTRINPYPYIKNCKILAQTSRYEGKSVVVDEAKILGKPILATSYPTVKDQISDGTEGIIVSMDSKGIADGIERLLVDDKLREKIEINLKSKDYGNQNEVKKYIELFEK